MDSHLEYMGITGVSPTVITARIFSKSHRYPQITKNFFKNHLSIINTLCTLVPN